MPACGHRLRFSLSSCATQRPTAGDRLFSLELNQMVHRCGPFYFMYFRRCLTVYCADGIDNAGSDGCKQKQAVQKINGPPASERERILLSLLNVIIWPWVFADYVTRAPIALYVCVCGGAVKWMVASARSPSRFFILFSDAADRLMTYFIRGRMQNGAAANWTCCKEARRFVFIAVLAPGASARAFCWCLFDAAPCAAKKGV